MSYSSEVLADSPLAYYRLNVVAHGTASASSAFSGEPASNAFDSNPATVWDTNGTSSGWLQNQLTGAYVAIQYAIRRRDDIPTRMPKDWTFKGSNDGSTWTTLDTQTGITWPTAGETKVFTFSNSTAYTYYRLDVTANNGDTYLSVADMYIVTLNDTSGNAHHGLLFGNPAAGTSLLASDTADGSVVLNGSTHYGLVTYASWQSPSTFTVEALIKPSSVSGTRVIASRQGIASGSAAWTFRQEGTALKFYVWNGTASFFTATSSVTLAVGTAHHVAATYDGTTARIYVDGVSTGTAAGTMYNLGTAALRLGASEAGEAYAGTVDELAFYGTALSGTRIAAHYAAATTVGTAAGGTASLSLSASGGAGAASAGTASLSLGASGGAGTTAAGTAQLDLSATGTLTPPTAAAGAASLALSATGGAIAAAAGSASLDLVATGAALASEIAAGTASLTLSASGSAVLSAGGTAVLTLSASGIAIALFETDTSNAFDGLDLECIAYVTIVRPPAPVPPSLVLGERVDKAVPYPTPTMVGGRPT